MEITQNIFQSRERLFEKFFFSPFLALLLAAKFFQAQIKKNIFQNFHIPVYRFCPVVSIASRDSEMFT